MAEAAVAWAENSTDIDGCGCGAAAMTMVAGCGSCC